MAAAFTQDEKIRIRQQLRIAAMEHAQLVGMRKTSVDVLVEDVGISKGAFYSFYESKEMLFLDMLENWYREICAKATHAYQEHTNLPPVERASFMFKEAFRLMACQQLSKFIYDDVPLLLRKLPKEVIEEHYLADDAFILQLMNLTEVQLAVSKETAIAIIRILLMSLLYAKEVGANYGQAMDALIDSACRQLIRE